MAADAMLGFSTHKSDDRIIFIPRKLSCKITMSYLRYLPLEIDVRLICHVWNFSDILKAESSENHLPGGDWGVPFHRLCSRDLTISELLSKVDKDDIYRKSIQYIFRERTAV